MWECHMCSHKSREEELKLQFHFYIGTSSSYVLSGLGKDVPVLFWTQWKETRGLHSGLLVSTLTSQ